MRIEVKFLFQDYIDSTKKAADMIIFSILTLMSNLV